MNNRICACGCKLKVEGRPQKKFYNDHHRWLHHNRNRASLRKVCAGVYTSPFVPEHGF